MQGNMIGDRIVRPNCCGQNKGELVLPDDVTGAIFHAGLWTRIRERLKTERRLVVVRGLLRVADPEFHIIGSLERKKIGFGGWGCFRSSDGRFHKRERFSDVPSS